jgi:hypothetical protein
MGVSARPSESHADAHDHTAAAPAGASGAPGAIDIEKLAEKVYRLMVADVRVELARRGGSADQR